MIHESITYYRCPNFGKLNYTCVTYDYCDAKLNLVCGNGSCGQVKFKKRSNQIYIFEFFSQACPDNWIKINKTCYFVDIKNRTFSDAENNCTSRQANLLTIKTSEKLTVLNGLLGNYSSNFFWV
jgi:hypothetical protein